MNQPNKQHEARGWNPLVKCTKDAFAVLQDTPDIDLKWNDEQQLRAKEGIVSAMGILLQGMKDSNV